MTVDFKRLASVGALTMTLAWLPVSLAVKTELWTREGRTLLVGTFDRAVASSQQGLLPGPEQIDLATPPAPVIWDLLLDGNQVVVAAGDDSGVLISTPGSDKPRSLALKGQGEVLALAKGARNSIFAATGPQGAVHQVDLKRGDAKEIFRPEAEYIWDLLLLPDGDLVVATGLPAKVFRVDPRTGESVVIWESRDAHVRCLALRDGKVLAGTAGSGWIVELDGHGNGFVIWDSGRAEVVDLLADSTGTVWAALSGKPGDAASGGTGEPSRTEDKLPGATTTITVRASVAEEESSEKPSQKKTKTKTSGGLPGGGGSLLRIPVNGQPVKVWSDRSETPLDLEWMEGAGLLMATGTPARVWLFDSEGHDGWWDEHPASKSVTALAVDGSALVAASSNPPALTLYPSRAADVSTWVSDVLDTKGHSRFGRVRATTTEQAAGQVKVFARSGNTSEPVDGWSAWREIEGAAAPPGADGGASGVPDARFLQLRVEMRAESVRQFAVSGLSASYRPLNRPPRFSSVTVQPPGVAYRPLPPPAMAAGDIPVAAVPKSEQVSKALAGKSRAWRSKKFYEPGVLTVTWAATDPDGDTLEYRIESCRDRGGSCESWQMLGEGLTRGFHSFDSRALEDGIYRFRVSADDSPSNPHGEGQVAREISARVRIDHAPPQIDQLTVQTNGKRTEVVVKASDPGGVISGAEFLDESGKWITLAAKDGIADGAAEEFHVKIPAVDAVTVRVVDGAGNTTTRRSR